MSKLVFYSVFLLGLAILLWLALFLRAQWVSRALEQAAPPRGEIIDVDSSPMHVYITGQPKGEAPDLVLIHGSNGSTRDMTFTLAPILAERYRVLVIDRPGLGYSAAVNPTGDSLRQQAERIAKAAAHYGAEKPIVMGHSYGGSVALAWAVYMPEQLSAVVPVSAASHPWDTPLDPLYQIGSHPVLGRLILPLLPAVVTEARMEAVLTEVFKPDPVPAGYFEFFQPRLSLRYASMRATSFQRASLLSEIEAMAPLYPKLDLPMEIVHGTDDITVGLGIHSEPLLEDVPNATLTRASGHGHMIQHSAPQAIVEAIDRAAARAR